MAKNGTTKPPSKPQTDNIESAKPKVRGRRRKARIEDDPRVQAWRKGFIGRHEEEHGFAPNDDQANQAFVAWAFRGEKP